MRIVLDTNVLISGLLSPNGKPAQILNLFLNKKLVLLYDNRILFEYIKVLHREKFDFKDEWINPLLDFLRSEGEYISAEPSSVLFSDEEDKKFYEVATSGSADYLITGNLRHFPNDDIIVSPGDFIKSAIVED